MAELKGVLKSPVNLKIISFFHENQQTLDTARNIAAWLNHDQAEIKQALDFLASQGILVAHRTGGTTAYAYTQEKGIIGKIDKFLQGKM